MDRWTACPITGTEEVIGGDFTTVPGPGSVSNTFFSNPGPGNAPAEDSINFIFMGSSDIPCRDGWRTITGFTRTVDYERSDVQGPQIPNEPSEKNTLYRFRLVYYPGHVEVYTDLNKNGQMDLLSSYNVDVPWDEVYVVLLGIAYQADHHPQNDACFQGPKRDIQWKDVSIGPVKYARSAAFPKQNSTAQDARNSGWLGFDLRDTVRHGTLKGIPQPNAKAYDKSTSVHICSDINVNGCNANNVASETNLSLNIPDGDVVARALFTYDIRRSGGATLYVNGTLVGELPRANLPSQNVEEWIHRSIEVPTNLIWAGNNTIRLVYSADVQMDRLQFEVYYGRAGETRLPGDISTNGVYTAPATFTEDAKVTVTATSVDDPSISGTATITVLANVK